MLQKIAAYGVEIESLVLEINAPAAYKKSKPATDLKEDAG
ncbi:hypothetical protein QYE_1555 [Escherichia coli B107]|nr:hypothetical protein QYE_1555 [Escherichia coli B107]